MKLKSFGCSFIFGSELSDDGKNGPYAVGSRLTWPALSAQRLGFDYQCYAKPGSGNFQLMERVLEQTTNIEPALYVIGWTWIDRFDYIDESADPWPGSKWNTIMPIDDTDLARTYYKKLHSEYQDKLRSLTAIRVTIDTLKSKNLPFIMTYMDDLIFETKWHHTPAIAELQNYVKPYMTLFNEKTFLEWSRENKFLESEYWHPLEDAHIAAANYMLELGVHKV